MAGALAAKPVVGLVFVARVVVPAAAGAAVASELQVAMPFAEWAAGQPVGLPGYYCRAGRQGLPIV